MCLLWPTESSSRFSEEANSVAEEEDAGAEIPEWVVTFGDMMSLLLTFFIMLVSMSEIKDSKFQALEEALKQQFGPDTVSFSRSPGLVLKPRKSALAKLATNGMSQRHGTMRGGAEVKSPQGDFAEVRIIRAGSEIVTGTVVSFEHGKTELTDQTRRQLEFQSRLFRKSGQKIEIRGHTTRRPLSVKSPFEDHWELAHARSQAVKRLLIAQGINSVRLNVTSAGAEDPLYTSIEKFRANDRVEVFLTPEEAQFGANEAEATSEVD